MHKSKREDKVVKIVKLIVLNKGGSHCVWVDLKQRLEQPQYWPFEIVISILLNEVC